MDFTICKECGFIAQSYRSLSQHLRQGHSDMTLQSYYDRHYKKPDEGICKVCGKPTKFSGRLNRGYYEHCSAKCTALDKVTVSKRKETNRKIHGDENFNNHEQTCQTKLERYNDPNFANVNQIRATKLVRHGSAGYNNTKKREITKEKKFGDKNFVNPEKAMDTKELKYGSRTYNNNKKAERTKSEKYSDPHFVNPDKARQTVSKKTIASYAKVLKAQCEILSYDNQKFRCKCFKCGNEFDIPITTGYMRLYRYGTNWCTVCNPPETSRSSEEKALFDYVQSLVGDSNVIKSCRDVVNGIELDIYIPSKKLAIEFDGLYWHDERRKDNDYHLHKTELCEQQGIHLVHVFEDEWIYNQEIVKSRLAGMLGFNSKIRASKCVVKTLSSKDADQFLEENHIQGSCVSSWRYGLYFGKKDFRKKLVAVMTFGKNRFGDGVELLRFCTAKNTNVLGGASRLFKHFVDDHPEIETIISFADRRWSGNSPFYPNLGFDEDGVSKPSYYYVINNRRHNRLEFTKGKLVKAGFDESLSEHDIMLKRKIYRIYDCGNRRFVWHKK